VRCAQGPRDDSLIVSHTFSLLHTLPCPNVLAGSFEGVRTHWALNSAMWRRLAMPSVASRSEERQRPWKGYERRLCGKKLLMPWPSSQSGWFGRPYRECHGYRLKVEALTCLMHLQHRREGTVIGTWIGSDIGARMGSCCEQGRVSHMSGGCVRIARRWLSSRA